LNQSIQLCQQALDITPQNHPDRAIRLLHLADAYQRDNDRGGSHQTIQLFQQALDITPQNHPDRVFRLRRLAYAYQDNKSIDLTESIDIFQQALNMTPENHSERATRLQDLADAYNLQFQQTAIITHLNQSIQFRQQALDITPKNDSNRVYELQTLADAFFDRFEETQSMIDFDQYVQLSQQILDITPENNISYNERLKSLARAYKDRFEETNIISDLSLYIQHYQKFLDITAEPDLNRASWLQDLASAYKHRFQRTECIIDMEQSIRLGQEALEHSNSDVEIRLSAGIELLKSCAEVKSWSQAYQAASRTVSLITLLAPRFDENLEKQHSLTETFGLASDAAAVALMAEKQPYEAIQLLDLGRGVIIGLLNELRSDISDLQQKHPQLAEEFIRLRDQLDAPTDFTFHAHPRYYASMLLEQKIEAIRKLPHFDRFLLAPSIDELRAAAASGPIVIINVSNYRCDALIIENSEIRSLRLPGLNSEDVRTRAEALTNPSLLDVELLEWLWDTVTEPVLDALGFTDTPRGCWPRMWWIPTGPLAKFPMHAAGYHSSSNTVLDRVISSYSSSVKTFVQSHQTHTRPKGSRRPKKVVLVGMQDLPHVTQEIDELEDLCGSMQLQVLKPRPYRNDVLAALDDCEIFHFAGHGSTDLSNPSASGLIMSDKPLTVASLFEINLHTRQPFLAYLSACGTGQIEHKELIDEGLHLIAACQLAGFQHVIGTLWRVNDEFCAKMATMTYEWMRAQGISDASISEGLHHASRRLRGRWVTENATRASRQIATEQWRSNQGKVRGRAPRDIKSCDDTPLYWVPYVHFGV
jgi:hypothetical protein